MENKNKIVIAVTDFSVSPGPRYCSQGEDSGEAYYHEVLNPVFVSAYDSNKCLSIVLDGADGYASSFLDEAFGNLVYDFGSDIVLKTIDIISNEEPEWVEMIVKDTCTQWQKRREENKPPRVTISHQPWTRLVNNQLTKEVWEKMK